MRDRGLGEAGGRGDVAGADGAIRRELPHDRQPRRIGERCQEPDVGIIEACHALHGIDVLLY
jgi:hypothetical protein